MTNRILPIIALIIAIGIFFGYINPTWNGSIATAKAAIASDDQALAAANAFAVQQNQLVQARAAINPADLTRLATFLPSSVDDVGFILDLNALAARSGISLSNINVMTNGTSAGSGNSSTAGFSAATDPVGSIDLSLSAVGTYAALQAFLSGVEESERLIDVRAITIAGSDTGVYNYGITMRIYWLR